MTIYDGNVSVKSQEGFRKEKLNSRAYDNSTLKQRFGVGKNNAENRKSRYLDSKSHPPSANAPSLVQHTNNCIGDNKR